MLPNRLPVPVSQPHDDQVRFYARKLRQLRDCNDVEAIRCQGKMIHEQIEAAGVRVNAFLGNHIVDVYLRCRNLRDAHRVFIGMPSRDVVVWTNMIAAYARQGHYRRCFGLFCEMQLDGVEPDCVTFTTIVSACAGDRRLAHAGKVLHARICARGLHHDAVIGSALIKMYANYSLPGEALRVFREMPKPDVVAWTSIIAAFGHNGDSLQALWLYGEMQLEGMSPDELTFVALLDSCCSLCQGRMIHADMHDRFVIPLHNVVLSTALLNMYARCGSLSDAKDVFNTIPAPNVITWTSIISATAQAGECKEALLLYHRMQHSGMKPNAVTLATVVTACATTAELLNGRCYHSHIVEAGFIYDVVALNALVNMYGKCGALDDARSVYDFIPRHSRSIISWNAMLTAYAQQGYAEQALDVFHELLLYGVEVDCITVASLLIACSRKPGLLEAGCSIFTSLLHGELGKAQVSSQHCSCIVDLLARSGYLSQAEEFIHSAMPFPQDDVVWMSLVGACRSYGDWQRGERAAKRVLELNPTYTGAYMLLSDIYAAQGRWDELLAFSTARNNLKKHNRIS